MTLFDKAEAPGGLLRFGIPNFKLNKNIIDRRMAFLKAEGIQFEMGVEVNLQNLPAGFDAYCICVGGRNSKRFVCSGKRVQRNTFCYGDT